MLGTILVFKLWSKTFSTNQIQDFFCGAIHVELISYCITLLLILFHSFILLLVTLLLNTRIHLLTVSSRLIEGSF